MIPSVHLKDFSCSTIINVCIMFQFAERIISGSHLSLEGEDVKHKSRVDIFPTLIDHQGVYLTTLVFQNLEIKQWLWPADFILISGYFSKCISVNE